MSTESPPFVFQQVSTKTMGDGAVMVGLEHIPKRSDNILVQQVDGTTVLLSVEGGEYYALDEIGSRVWELCDGSHSVGAIIERICAEYEAPPEMVQADVLELLGELTVEKILV